MAHQGLGHGGVDAVHAHVVAVVGGPAQGQLGEVAGAHHQAAAAGWRCPSAPGCAPGPGRFQRSRPARPWTGRCPGSGCCTAAPMSMRPAGWPPAARASSTALSRVRSVVPKQGMVTAMHVAGGAGPAAPWRAPVTSRARVAVQPAGQAHHRRLGAGVLQPLFQAQCGLDVQDLARSARPRSLGVVGHEGRGVDTAGEGGLGARLQSRTRRVIYPSSALGAEGGHAARARSSSRSTSISVDGEPGGKAAARPAGRRFRRSGRARRRPGRWWTRPRPASA